MTLSLSDVDIVVRFMYNLQPNVPLVYVRDDDDLGFVLVQQGVDNVPIQLFVSTIPIHNGECAANVYHEDPSIVCDRIDEPIPNNLIFIPWSSYRYRICSVYQR